MKFLNKKDKIKLFYNATKNLTYLGGNKKLSPPIIAWLLTKRCNLTCVHCTSYLDRKKIDGKALIEIAHKIARSETQVIILSGGEPLIVPQIKEIIKILKESGKIIKINTNGLNLMEYADFMIENKVDCIAVSMDGVDAQTHDSIRGKTGSFENALNALKYIRQNRKNHTPHLEVRGVVMQNNFQMMPEYVKCFSEIVDTVGFQPIHNHKAHHEVVDENVLFTSQIKQLEAELKETIHLLAKEYSDYDNSYYKSFPDFFFHTEKIKSKALNACLPTWMLFMPIDEKGDCLTCTQKIGNALETEIEEAWYSDKRIGFLRNISKQVYCNSPCWLNYTSVSPEWHGKGLKNVNKISKEIPSTLNDFKNSETYESSERHHKGIIS